MEKVSRVRKKCVEGSGGKGVGVDHQNGVLSGFPFLGCHPPLILVYDVEVSVSWET